ncbi:pentapeptide repeat-containing protein [Streptomyces lavendulocolor]|uniref:pentapeptide repeat-containing protein n=1 Tax=Streptomyces lavendulocolor TaxID=67316 RepID=UPI003C2EBD13
MQRRPAHGRFARIAHRRAARLRRRRRHSAGAQGRAPHDGTGWISLLVLSLPGLAALAALLFTWMQVGQANKELRLGEQGQVTSRFNAAIGNLGSDSEDVRLGGLYALERLMHDSTRDHPTVVSVVSAYVRRHAPVRAGGARKPVPADIDAAMKVLSRRPPGREQQELVDLSRTDLRGWQPAFQGEETVRWGGAILTGADLSGANLSNGYLREAVFDGATLRESYLGGADLRGATFNGSDLRGAQADTADLRGASLDGADLRDTNLFDANLGKSWFCRFALCADLTGTVLVGADLAGSGLAGANLTQATLCLTAQELTVGDAPASPATERDVRSCATLRGADLSRARLTGLDLAGADLRSANLTGADLAKADLTKADLRKADLRKADLTGAKLSGARLTGAKLSGAKGLPASLR